MATSVCWTWARPISQGIPANLIEESGDAPVPLSVTEFKLLRTLAEAEGKVLSRDRIRDLVWGLGHAMTPHTIDVHIKRLRGKLGDGGDAIKTVRGQGYKIEA